MQAGKDYAAVWFFPPGVPLLAIIAGYLMDCWVPLDVQNAVGTPLRYWLGGTIVVGSILLLGLWPVLLFRRGGQSANPWKPTPQIERRGPYRFSRNPMYLQMVLVCLGVGIATLNLWIIALTPLVGWALYAVAIKPEEAYLAHTFGADYLDYLRQVRRWM